MFRILLVLGFFIFMTALTIAQESIAAVLFGAGVLLTGNELCKRTNWMDEEGDET